MSQTPDWETQLNQEAIQCVRTPGDAPHIAATEQQVQQAFAECERITACNSKTFHLATSLLPRPKQLAMRGLYAFCRTTDDIVDLGGDSASRELSRWRQKAVSPQVDATDPVILAWSRVRGDYSIPGTLALRLIEAMADDIAHTRYPSFAHLADYCYAVAATVGLMSMHITGFEGEEAIPYAIRLGIALQLTNILRDVGEDWQRGRVYLPQDELARHGLSDEDIGRAVVDDRWRSLMRLQIARAREMYRAAWPGIAMLSPDGQFAVAAAAQLYSGILGDIEAHGYDVFTRRAHVSAVGKLLRLPGIWWRVRRLAGSPTSGRG